MFGHTLKPNNQKSIYIYAFYFLEKTHTPLDESDESISAFMHIVVHSLGDRLGTTLCKT